MKKMNRLAAIALLLLTAGNLNAQKYFTKTGKISFFSKTSMENIEAHNKSVTCVVDTKSGAVAFSVLMKGFEFEKALMQDHFNENYVESSKYPKAEFKGTITNNSDVNYTQDGVYTTKVKGKMTLHGVTKDVETTGKITVKGGKVIATSDFVLLLSDYKITIPSVVKDNISNSIKIMVDCTLEPLK
jgi:YceI-like domain